MSLRTYQEKRSFQKTPEPSGRHKAKRTASKSQKQKALHFVVQKHAASHLHYDFRLEVDGVLKSWAIPKGPSLNPENKRLAMQVEDHPLEYRYFEGAIPKGNYGAGAVMIWDEGTYTVDPKLSVKENEALLEEGLNAGKITFILNGQKLRGQFSLVKTHGSRYGKENAWLLIKTDDEFSSTDEILLQTESIEIHRSLDEIQSSAVKASRSSEKSAAMIPEGAIKAKMPHCIKPMLSTLVDDSFDRKGWFFELKLDGYRCISEIKKNEIEMYSRNFLSFKSKFKAVYQSLQELSELQDILILDGEVVALDDAGKPSFQLLQDYEHHQERLVYYVFDLLFLNGYDLRELPLKERKRILKAILPKDSGLIRYCDHVEEKGTQFFKAIVDQGLEGMMAKDGESPYLSGKRTSRWLKIKAQKQQEAIICGFTQPRGSRKKIGALILGVYENDELRYIGHTGTGMSDHDLNDLYQRLQLLKISKYPFAKAPKTNEKPTWVKPKLVCEIRFTEWTQDGHARHPVYLGLRLDKAPSEVMLEKELPVQETVELEIPSGENKNSVKKKFASESPKLSKQKEEAKPSTRKKFAKETVGSKDLILHVNQHTVRISNPNKVLWPALGYRKKELVGYYQEMAAYILPYLKDRPFVLHRFPEGIDHQSFYQKDMNQALPDWIETTPIFSESDQETKNYILCQNEETLLFLANLGCIELNPWNSRRQHLENPDWMVIDLDPGEIGFEKVIEAAQVVHQILDEWQVPNYCKTSGATGLHIYVPMGAKYDYEIVKNFAQVVATLAHKQLLKSTSLERSSSKRKTKIYLDYLQNRYGQTLVAPYSLRPTPEATVSTPLHWEEVKRGLKPQQFTMQNIGKRVQKEGDLWKPILGKGLDLQRLMKRLDH